MRKIKTPMQQNQSEPSHDTNIDEPSFMQRIEIAFAKNSTKIGMISGSCAGFIGGSTTQRRLLQSILGALVPLVAFAYLDG